MVTILGSIVAIIWGGGGLYDHTMSTIIFTLITNKIFIQAPKNYEGSGYGLNLYLLTLQLCEVNHILGEVD